MTLWGEWHTHSVGVDEYVDPYRVQCKTVSEQHITGHHCRLSICDIITAPSQKINLF